MSALKLVNLKAQNVYQLKFLSLVLAERFKLTVERRPSLVARSNFLTRISETCVGVQNFKMRVRVEERLLFALPVYVNEERTDFAQERQCGELMIDEDSVSTR